MQRGLDLLNIILQSLHILNPQWKIGGAVTVANEQKLKKQGLVNKRRTFVVVSCLLNQSKLCISFDFVLDWWFVYSFTRNSSLQVSATLNFCVSVDFTTNKLSKLALASFGKREGLYKSISSSIVLLEINKRKSSMLVTENATVLKLFLF